MHNFSNLFDNVLYMFRRSTVHHQEYLNAVYMQQAFVILVLLGSASMHGQDGTGTLSNKFEK